MFPPAFQSLFVSMFICLLTEGGWEIPHNIPPPQIFCTFWSPISTTVSQEHASDCIMRQAESLICVSVTCCPFYSVKNTHILLKTSRFLQCREEKWLSLLFDLYYPYQTYDFEAVGLIKFLMSYTQCFFTIAHLWIELTFEWNFGLSALSPWNEFAVFRSEYQPQKNNLHDF